jgi:hypothetical protein
MEIEVSNGELIDKLIIIQIKLERIREEDKLVNLKKEFALLKEAATGIMEETDPLFKDLYRVNCELWDIENRIREKESKANFDSEFIEIARSVYKKNDERFDIKRKINIQTSSHLTEEKSYQK